MKRFLIVEMPDGSKWSVPTRVIADSRSTHYASEFGGSVQRSYSEDTKPLFDEDEYEIQDWAANNMNWSDVEKVAVRLAEESASVDYQEGWVNGDKELRD
jgi:hypothetical protein